MPVPSIAATTCAWTSTTPRPASTMAPAPAPDELFPRCVVCQQRRGYRPEDTELASFHPRTEQPLLADRLYCTACLRHEQRQAAHRLCAERCIVLRPEIQHTLVARVYRTSSKLLDVDWHVVALWVGSEVALVRGPRGNQRPVQVYGPHVCLRAERDGRLWQKILPYDSFVQQNPHFFRRAHAFLAVLRSYSAPGPDAGSPVACLPSSLYVGSGWYDTASRLYFDKLTAPAAA